MGIANDLLESLNEQQRLAVTHEDGPLLIVAGAGTGKTTVITRKIAYLATSGRAKPDEIAALTFTEKAAGEMQERIDLLLPLGGGEPWICTFHGFCERVLRSHGLDIGLPNDFKLLDDMGQWVFVYRNLDRFRLDYYRPRGNPSKFIDALLAHFSRCKDEMITPQEYLDYSQTLQLGQDTPTRLPPARKGITAVIAELPKVAQEQQEASRAAEVAEAYFLYQKLLLDNNFLDFGDLIGYTLELFAKRPAILNHYQKKFKHLLVDEFQDTNLAQYELVKLLAEPRRNLTVVGDDDQSIYKFRGASFSNILKLARDYPKIKQVALLDNYRSSQKILDLAYQFIQSNNPDRLETKLKIDKRLRSHNPAEGVVEVLEANDLAGELELVCKKILELKNEQGSSWNDFAILLRRNSTADALLPALGLWGIPFTFVANRGLYKKTIIADLIAYLKTLGNCFDSAALYRSLTMPNFGLQAAALACLLSHAHKKTISLYEALQQAGQAEGMPAREVENAKLALASIDKHAELAKKSAVSELFVQVVRDLELQKRLAEDTLENAENRELVEQFFKKIENFQENEEGHSSLKSFLEFLEMEQLAGNQGEIRFDPNLGPESLKVLTVHAAKGLEFKNVFIVSLVDQQFPSREKSEAIEIPESLIRDILPEGDFHLQEERRLFYVAITRAKTNLYLSWAKDYGGKRQKKPSLFLQETKLVPSKKLSLATGQVVFAKPERKKIVYRATPTHFSYSQLHDFEICPLKYKYQHYLKLPVKGSPFLSFGQTMHKVFEEYLSLFRRNLELPQRDLFGEKPEAVLPDFPYLEKLYEQHWVDNWYFSQRQKQEYKESGKKMLKTFYSTLQERGCKPKHIERAFTLPLGNYFFKGKIDRADETPGGLDIWDYKTGKAPKKGEKRDLDQLKVYQWAARDFLKEPVSGLRYWYLEDNIIIEEEVAEDNEIDQLKAELLQSAEKIVQTVKYDLFKQEHDKAKDHKCDFSFLE